MSSIDANARAYGRELAARARPRRAGRARARSSSGVRPASRPSMLTTAPGGSLVIVHRRGSAAAARAPRSTVATTSGENSELRDRPIRIERERERDRGVRLGGAPELREHRAEPQRRVGVQRRHPGQRERALGVGARGREPRRRELELRRGGTRASPRRSARARGGTAPASRSAPRRRPRPSRASPTASSTTRRPPRSRVGHRRGRPPAAGRAARRRASPIAARIARGARDRARSSARSTSPLIGTSILAPCPSNGSSARPMRKHGAKLRAQVAAAELADRAGTLFRLGFTQAAGHRSAWPRASRGSTTRRRSTARTAPRRAVRCGDREDRRRHVRAPPGGWHDRVSRSARASPACSAAARRPRADAAAPAAANSSRCSISSATGAGCTAPTKPARRASRTSAGGFAPIREHADAARRPLRAHRRRRARSIACRSSATSARRIASARCSTSIVELDRRRARDPRDRLPRPSRRRAITAFATSATTRAELAGDRLALELGHDGGRRRCGRSTTSTPSCPIAPWPATLDADRPVAVGRDVDRRRPATSATRPSGGRSRGAPTRSSTRRTAAASRSAAPDGKPIACAGAPSWTFDDAYVLDGQREEEHWHFHELAVEPGDHPCLRATPQRTSTRRPPSRSATTSCSSGAASAARSSTDPAGGE